MLRPGLNVELGGPDLDDPAAKLLDGGRPLFFLAELLVDFPGSKDFAFDVMPGLKPELGGPLLDDLDDFFFRLSSAFLDEFFLLEEKLVAPGKPEELGAFEVDDFELVEGEKLFELGGEKPPDPPDLFLPSNENDEDGGPEDFEFVFELEGENVTDDFAFFLGPFLFSSFIFPGFVFSTKLAGCALESFDDVDLLFASFSCLLSFSPLPFPGDAPSSPDSDSALAISSESSFLNFELKTAQEPKPTKAPITASLEASPNECLRFGVAISLWQIR